MSVRERVRLVPEVVVASVGALAVLGPLLGRGYVLTYDMVFVPEQPLTGQLFGIASFAPRAVPSDLLVALASRLLPADVVQKLVLLTIVVLGAWGAGRALRLVLGTQARGRGTDLAAGAAATAYLWGPFFYERLVIGQWALLVGWAALPWVVVALVGVACADGAARRRGWGVLVVAVVAAACGSPAGGLLVGAVAVVGLLLLPGAWRLRMRDAAAGLLCVVAANAPWWVPAMLVSRDVLSVPDPSGVDAFAARSDTLLGSTVSLASGGAIWNSEVVPPGRGTPAVAALVVVGLAAAVAGLPTLMRAHAAIRGAASVGLAGLAVAALGTGPAAGVVRWVVTEVPGGGLLRDTQKLVMPVVLVTALALGCAVRMLAVDLAARWPARAAWLLAGALAALPVLTTPALAWGAAGRLQTVDYPIEWAAARDAVAADSEGGDLLVLPWSLYRRYAWNPGTTLLTPAQRWFDRRAVTNDTLPVGTVVVKGEDRRAAELDPLVDRALAPGAAPAEVADEMAEHGVRWVLVERSTGMPPVPEGGLSDLDVVLDGEHVALYAVAGTRPSQERERLPPVGAAVAAFAAMTCTAAAGVVLRFSLDARKPLLPFGSRRRRYLERTPDRAHDRPDP